MLTYFDKVLTYYLFESKMLPSLRYCVFTLEQTDVAQWFVDCCQLV